MIPGTRLIYAIVFKLFGGNVLSFRILEVAGIALVAGLFFVLAKRRVGPAIALALSIPLLFFGSASEATLLPQGLQHAYCIAAGLGALLALERDSPRADVGVCALLIVSVAIYSVGLAFVAGVAVSVLLRRDRRERSWTFAVPADPVPRLVPGRPEDQGPQSPTPPRASFRRTCCWRRASPPTRQPRSWRRSPGSTGTIREGSDRGTS